MSLNECDRDDKGKCRRKLKRGMELKCNIALTHARTFEVRWVD